MLGGVLTQNHRLTKTRSAINNIEIAIKMRISDDVHSLARRDRRNKTSCNFLRFFLFHFAVNKATCQCINCRNITGIFTLQVLINNRCAFANGPGYLCLAVSFAGHKVIQFNMYAHKLSLPAIADFFHIFVTVSFKEEIRLFFFLNGIFSRDKAPQVIKSLPRQNGAAFGFNLQDFLFNAFHSALTAFLNGYIHCTDRNRCTFIAIPDGGTDIRAIHPANNDGLRVMDIKGHAHVFAVDLDQFF
ncbi:Uncharacterised protein [Klebsiella pneumoniae]|nr:Uncharacterised protein [Klebsiella pneumoniae]